MSGALALSALLAQEENGVLRHVAGPRDVVWDAVVVEAGEFDLPDDGAARLAILTAGAPVATWQQDAMLRRVRDRGFTGLALPGAADVDPGALRLADRIGLALLDVKRPVQLARACWMLIEARDALTLTRVRKVAQSFEYAAADLGDLLGHLAANLGLGVALIDAAGVLREAGGHLGAELHAAIRFDSWSDGAKAGEGTAASVRVDSPGRSGLRLVLFGDGLGEAQLQSLMVAAEVAMPVVAARILIDEIAAVNDVAASSGLLRDFVELRGAADADVERRMAERGWRTGGHHLGFRMVARGRLEPLALLRAIRPRLSAIDAEAHATTAGRGLSGWLSFTEAPGPDRIERAVGALRDLHLAACATSRWRPGWAPHRRDPRGWRRRSMRPATQRASLRTDPRRDGSSASIASGSSSSCSPGPATTPSSRRRSRCSPP